MPTNNNDDCLELRIEDAVTLAILEDRYWHLSTMEYNSAALQVATEIGKIHERSATR